MIVCLFAVATTTITDSIITGSTLAIGIYCSSRTGKNTYKPKKAK